MSADAGPEPRARAALRVGFYGVLGSGNLGNDGSLQAVIEFLRERHPEVSLGFLAMGPERLAATYGAPATPMQWYEAHLGWLAAVPSPVLKVVGRLLDPFRTLAWARRYDVVIVPGMGVLEATTPTRPWGFPYQLFWLCLWGRLVGTRVALLCVGADVITKRATRWLVAQAGRLAHYRSFRDELSRDAMRMMGVDTGADEVYPDLAFALDVPAVRRPGSGVVGIGVMDYHGGNDDRGQAAEIHQAYLATVQRFAAMLVAEGRTVRLFTGDKADEDVLAQVLTAATAAHPQADVMAERATTLAELMQVVAGVDSVVATRYHNVLSALKLAVPIVSLSYARKNDVLMASMGLGEFCEPARSSDFDGLLIRFRELENRHDELVETMLERNRVMDEGIERQWQALSAFLRGSGRPTGATLSEPARSRSGS